jgi:hypothetical protein
MFEGWRDSSGIAREVAFFKGRGRPIHYVSGDAEIDLNSLYEKIAVDL